MAQYDAEILRVIDGDTIDVRINLGLQVEFEQRVRVDGVNAPEKNTVEGISAKEFTTEWAGRHPFVRLITGHREREKYGRILAQVQSLEGDDLTEALKDAGHGREYHGERRE